MTEPAIDRSELLAALAEVESGEAASFSEPAPPAAGAAASETATSPDEPTQSEEHLEAAPDASDDSPPVHVAGNTLIPIAELDAVMAEIDGLPPEQAAAIPSLEPSAAPASEASKPGPEISAAPIATAAPAAPSSKNPIPGSNPPAAGAPAKGIKFVIGRKAENPAGSEKSAGSKSEPPKRAGLPEPVAATLEDSPAEDDLNPRVTIGKRVYRLFDGVLEALNRPFQRLSGGLRGAVGIASVTTIIISLGTSAALPVIWPHRDAIAFLEEKRRELDDPKPKKSASGGQKAGHDDKAAAAPAH